MNYIFADGNWLAHRAFSVYGKSSSVPEKKIPNAILDWFSQGAVRWQCTGGALCFDGNDIFRHKVYTGYKATRKAAKDEAARHRFDEGLPPEDTAGAFIAPTTELFRSHGILVVQKPELEADDLLISAGTTFGKNPKNQVILEARDKDLFQGVRKNIRIFTPAMGVEKEIVWTPELVLAKRGMTPKQFLKYQILIGDATDDIPAIPEIGTPAKAKKIVLEFDKLSTFFTETEDGQRLFKKYKSEIARNIQLVTMVKNAWDIKDVGFKLVGSNSRSPGFAALKSALSKKSLF